MVQIENLPLTLTGLGLIASIIYYASVIRSQNRTREAQLFMQFMSPAMSGDKPQYWQQIMEWEWSDYDDFRRIHSDPKNKKSFSQISYYLESIGAFVKEGLIPVRLVAVTMTIWVTSFWNKFGSMIVEWRVRENIPRLLSETEYLYDELMKYIKKHPELAT
jgi:hypothetical protein